MNGTGAGWAPQRLAGLKGAGILAVCLLLIAVSAQGFGSIGDQRLAINFFIMLIAVLGLQVFIGNTGVLSFAHLAFMAAGAYAAALVAIPVGVRSSQLPDLPSFLSGIELGFLLALLAGVLFALVVAALTGPVFARFTGVAGVIATFALMAVGIGLLTGLDQVTGGARGLYGIPRDTTLWAAAVAAVIAIFLARGVRESRLGLRLSAVRQDELAAKAAGVNAHRTRMLAWIISGALMGLAGGLQAHSLAVVSPQSFDISATFLLLAMLILGGARSVTGAFMGVAVITLIGEVLRRFEGGFSIGPLHVNELFGLTPIVTGLIVLYCLFRRPDGLVRNEIETWFSSLRRRRATSNTDD